MRECLDRGLRVYLWVFDSPYRIPHAVLQFDNLRLLRKRQHIDFQGHSSVDLTSVYCSAALLKGTKLATLCSKEQLATCCSTTDLSANPDTPVLLPASANSYLDTQIASLEAYQVRGCQPYEVQQSMMSLQAEFATENSCCHLHGLPDFAVLLAPQAGAELLSSQACTISGLPEAAGATERERICAQTEAIAQAFYFAQERAIVACGRRVYKEHKIVYTAPSGNSNQRFIDIYVSSDAANASLCSAFVEFKDIQLLTVGGNR